MSEFLINKVVVFKNTTSYPISKDDIKVRGIVNFPGLFNTTDWDDFIDNFIIPKAIDNWEQETNYYLLDQTQKAFLSDSSYFTYCKIRALNLRSVESVEYYPVDWDQVSNKTLLDTDVYRLEPERRQEPPKIHLKTQCEPIFLFQQENNLEVNYKCGFESNDFTNLQKDIKDCLIFMTGQILDNYFTSLGLQSICVSVFDSIIKETYAKYSIFTGSDNFLKIL